MLLILVACTTAADVPPTPVPTSTPPRPVASIQLCDGSEQGLTNLDIAALQITGATVAPGIDGDLYDKLGNCAQRVVTVPAGTALTVISIADIRVSSLGGQGPADSLGYLVLVETPEGTRGLMQEKQLLFDSALQILPSEPVATPAPGGEPTIAADRATYSSLTIKPLERLGYPVAFIRSEPRPDAPIVALARAGQAVTLIGYQDDPSQPFVATSTVAYRQNTWYRVSYNRPGGGAADGFVFEPQLAFR
jgi:hypothetical protein